jgi:hypothetical protein
VPTPDRIVITTKHHHRNPESLGQAPAELLEVLRPKTHQPVGDTDPDAGQDVSFRKPTPDESLGGLSEKSDQLAVCRLSGGGGSLLYQHAVAQVAQDQGRGIVLDIDADS